MYSIFESFILVFKMCHPQRKKCKAYYSTQLQFVVLKQTKYSKIVYNTSTCSKI